VAGTSGAVADKQRHLEQVSECALATCQMVVEEWGWRAPVARWQTSSGTWSR
jgi:hypothetical protein